MRAILTPLSDRYALRSAPVAIFEPNDVVQLWRRYLEHVGIFDRDHPVAQARRDVERLAGAQLAAARRRAVGEELEPHAARKDHDRLVLHPVVLERERFARAHMQDLADVAIGLGP